MLDQRPDEFDHRNLFLHALLGMVSAARKLDSALERAGDAHRAPVPEDDPWLLCVLGMVAFLVWTYRVAKNLYAFDAPGDAPSLAVGWWFVPFACLWKPYQALVQVWLGSDPVARSAEERAQAPARTPWFFPIWWMMWLLSLLLGRIANVVATDNPASVEDWRTGMVFLVAGLVEDLIALALMLTVVWSLTRRQDLRGTDPMPRATAV